MIRHRSERRLRVEVPERYSVSHPFDRKKSKGWGTGDLFPVNESPRLFAAEGLKPAADIDLGVRLAAVVAGSVVIGCVFGPLEDGQLGVAAMNHDPPDRVIALFAADLTSINCAITPTPPCSQKQVISVMGFDPLKCLYSCSAQQRDHPEFERDNSRSFAPLRRESLGAKESSGPPGRGCSLLDTPGSAALHPGLLSTLPPGAWGCRALFSSASVDASHREKLR